MSELTAEQLKSKLAAGEPMTIVDIREQEKYDDWHIPGSMHVPVIEAMRANNPEPLRQWAPKLPKDQPLVVICNRGVSSFKAAMLLDSMGYDATSLHLGMKAWTFVHSTADVLLDGDSEVLQVRRNAKGCLSYLIASGDDAIVVDPSVPVGAYTELAEQRGVRITKVLETHVHADHLSRARELCDAIGAELVMPDNQRVNFDFTKVTDGDSIALGDAPETIKVIATPGHTGESVCYLLDDRALFTGDTLFTNAVGRPDLEKGDEGAEAGAHALYASLHEKVLPLDDAVLVLPAHTDPGIPFDGTPIMATLGDVRSAAKLLGESDESRFVNELVARLGEKPPSFDAIIAINEGRNDPPEDIADLEVGPNRCAGA